MHRLVVTITAPNEINESAVLETFASQLEDVAADIVLPGPAGSLVWRVWP
jgi:hypothetical protein